MTMPCTARRSRSVASCTTGASRSSMTAETASWVIMQPLGESSEEGHGPPGIHGGRMEGPSGRIVLPHG